MKKITKLMTTLALLTAGVERVDATTVLVADHFGNEITSIDYLTGGNKFVITDGANVLYFSSNQDAKSAALASVPSDSYFYYTLTKIEGLDLDNDGTVDNDIYAINIINEDGTAFRLHGTLETASISLTGDPSSLEVLNQTKEKDMAQILSTRVYGSLPILPETDSLLRTAL